MQHPLLESHLGSVAIIFSPLCLWSTVVTWRDVCKSDHKRCTFVGKKWNFYDCNAVTSWMGLANDLSIGGIVWNEETQVPPFYNSYWPLETKNDAEIDFSTLLLTTKTIHLSLNLGKSRLGPTGFMKPCLKSKRRPKYKINTKPQRNSCNVLAVEEADGRLRRYTCVSLELLAFPGLHGRSCPLVSTEPPHPPQQPWLFHVHPGLLQSSPNNSPRPPHSLGSLLLQSEGFIVPLIKQTLEMALPLWGCKTYPLLELQLGAISYLYAWSSLNPCSV